MSVKKSIYWLSTVMVTVFLPSCTVHKENYLAERNTQKIDPAIIGIWKQKIIDDSMAFFEVKEVENDDKLKINFWLYNNLERIPNSGKILLGTLQQYTFESHSLIVAFVDSKFEVNGVVNKIDPQWVYLRLHKEGKYCEWLEFDEEEKIDGLRKCLGKVEDPILLFEKTDADKPSARESNVIRLNKLKNKIEENKRELKRWEFRRH